MKNQMDRLKNLDRYALLIFLGALALRLLYLYQIQNSPFLNYPQIDALWHHLWAKSIASGNILGDEVFFRAPLYPYFLGLIYSIFGEGPIAPRIIQSILGSLSCVLIYLIALRLFNRRTALMAGIIAAIYSVLIYFDNELLITSLFVFLVLLFFYLSINTQISSSKKRLYLIGLVMGLAAIARPTVLITLPILVVYLFFYRVKPIRFKNKLIGVAILFAGILTAILPVTIRNYAVGNDIVLISYQGGVNFWIGNNEQADGKTAGAPGHFKAVGRYEDNVKYSAEKVAEMDTGREMKPPELSSYWYSRGFKFIFENPGEFMSLTLKKLYFTWNAYEIESNRNLYTQREHSSLLRILLWHNVLGLPFGILAPLAIAGIVLAFRNWKRTYFLLIGFLFSYQLILLTFFVTARFRVPMLPFMIILAAMALDYAIHNRRKISKLITPVIVFAVSIVVCNTTLFGVKPAEESRTIQSKASIFLRQGQVDSAIVYAQKAIDENPDDPAGYNFLGTAYEMAGKHQEAVNTFEKAVDLNLQNAYGYNHLGYNYYELGQLEKAVVKYRQAIHIDSTVVDAYVYLGNIYRDLGKQSMALDIFEIGKPYASENARFLNSYANVLRESGQEQEAIENLKKAVELDSQYLPAHTNLANLYFQTGQPMKAESMYKKALEIDPEDIQTNLNLAQLYIRTNWPERAKELIQNVLKDHPHHPVANRLMEMVEEMMQ